MKAFILSFIEINMSPTLSRGRDGKALKRKKLLFRAAPNCHTPKGVWISQEAISLRALSFMIKRSERWFLYFFFSRCECGGTFITWSFGKGTCDRCAAKDYEVGR